MSELTSGPSKAGQLCGSMHGLFKSESKALIATENTWYAVGVF